jgi:RHS repeat-associated protein
MRFFSYTYGTDGLLQSVTDALSRTTSISRDAAGRITSRTFPGGTTVSYGWDGTGQLATITPPGRPEHSFTYTLHGQLQSVTPPEVAGTGPVVLSYNDDLQPQTASRPGNEEITFDQDAHGRVDTIEYVENGVPTAAFTYTYSVADRVASITGPGSQVLSYNYLGDLLEIETWSGPVSGEVSWTYDNSLRAQSETVDGGATISFTYDDDDYITSAGDYNIARSAANALPETGSIGVLTDSWTYNTFGEVDTYTATANAVTLYAADYTRDALGRITQKIETIGGVTDTYGYSYDMLSQLEEVQKNSVVVESYTYDENGNRLSGTVGGVTSNGTYDDQDRLVDYGDADYLYTPAGRLESRTDPGPLVTAYDYDVAGNLLAVTLPDASVVTYGLDGLDRRIERVVNGTTTLRLIYDGLQPVAELDDMNNLISQFVYVGSHVPAYMIRGGVKYRLITDQIGSVRLVTDTATGTIAQRIDYDSFGNVLADTNPGFQPFGFAGGLYDPHTGLLRFGSRDYDPITSRWTAKDPSGFAGGDTNLYRYVNNQPVNLIDVAGSESGWSDFYEKVDKVWEWFNENLGDTEIGDTKIGDKSKKIKKPVDKAQKYLDKSQEILDTGLKVKEIWEDPQLNRPQKGRDIIGCFESFAQDIVDTFEKPLPILKALDVTPYFESFAEYMNMSEFGAGRAHYVDLDGGEAAIDENAYGSWDDADGY